MNPSAPKTSEPHLAYRWNTSIQRSVTREELPELLRNAMNALKCSYGTLARLHCPDGVSIHVAFFEWDTSSRGNSLEAFKHRPEQCLGTLGMSLIKECGIRKLEIDGQSFHFEHLLFRDVKGSPVHSFKAVSVAGAAPLTSDGFRGGFDHWRELRWRAAKMRFKPSCVAVVQGAVRDVLSPSTAWTLFQENILPDLFLESPLAS